MLFARVIRSEDTLALLGRQSGTGVLNFNEHPSVVVPRSQCQRAALRHCIHCIENQIRKGSMQQLRIGCNGFQSIVQLEIAINRGASCCLKLRLKEPCNCGHNVVHLYPLQLRLWHLGKFAEPANDPLEVGNFGKKSLRTLAKNFIEDLRTLTPRADQILNGELQWE